MLDAIGLSSEEDLVSYFRRTFVSTWRLDIEDGKSEYEIVDYFKRRAAENANGYPSFLGPAFTTITAPY